MEQVYLKKSTNVEIVYHKEYPFTWKIMLNVLDIIFPHMEKNAIITSYDSPTTTGHSMTKELLDTTLDLMEHPVVKEEKKYISVKGYNSELGTSINLCLENGSHEVRLKLNSPDAVSRKGIKAVSRYMDTIIASATVMSEIRKQLIE